MPDKSVQVCEGDGPTKRDFIDMASNILLSLHPELFAEDERDELERMVEVFFEAMVQAKQKVMQQIKDAPTLGAFGPEHPATHVADEIVQQDGDVERHIREIMKNADPAVLQGIAKKIYEGPGISP